MNKRNVQGTAILGGVGAAAGAIGGNVLGKAVEPLKELRTTDMSWGMQNHDGTVSHFVNTEVLNQGVHDAVVGASTLTGAAIMGAAGVAAGLYLTHKNRNLGRQFK
jgi:multisubunit Na+/H+ antiporter MnhB subunit